MDQNVSADVNDNQEALEITNEEIIASIPAMLDELGQYVPRPSEEFRPHRKVLSQLTSAVCELLDHALEGQRGMLVGVESGKDYGVSADELEERIAELESAQASLLSANEVLFVAPDEDDEAADR